MYKPQEPCPICLETTGCDCKEIQMETRTVPEMTEDYKDTIQYLVRSKGYTKKEATRIAIGELKQKQFIIEQTIKKIS